MTGWSDGLVRWSRPAVAGVAVLLLGGASAAVAASTGDRAPVGAVRSYDAGAVVIGDAAGGRPALSRAAAEVRLANSANGPDRGGRPLRLGRITVADAAGLVRPWLRRLAWYAEVDSTVADTSLCPVEPAHRDRPPAGPQQHVYAVDASGVGDGLVYAGPGINCGRRTAATAGPLLRLWSAPWRIRSAGAEQVVLAYLPPPCGTHESSYASSPYEWVELFTVPYGAVGCPARPARSTPISTDLVDGHRPPLPAVHQPLFGWVRVVDGGLLPPLREPR